MRRTNGLVRNPPAFISEAIAAESVMDIARPTQSVGELNLMSRPKMYAATAYPAMEQGIIYVTAISANSSILLQLGIGFHQSIKGSYQSKT